MQEQDIAPSNILNVEKVMTLEMSGSSLILTIHLFLMHTSAKFYLTLVLSPKYQFLQSTPSAQSVAKLYRRRLSFSVDPTQLGLYPHHLACVHIHLGLIIQFF